jgi:hypothetical protein
MVDDQEAEACIWVGVSGFGGVQGGDGAKISRKTRPRGRGLRAWGRERVTFAAMPFFTAPFRLSTALRTPNPSWQGFRAAFPDQHFTVEDEIGEGDKVIFRYVFRSTHRGEFQDIAPTSKQGTVAGIAIYQITGGHIEEVWVASDVLGLMQQLGAVPAPGQGGS